MHGPLTAQFSRPSTAAAGPPAPLFAVSGAVAHPGVAPAWPPRSAPSWRTALDALWAAVEGGDTSSATVGADWGAQRHGPDAGAGSIPGQRSVPGPAPRSARDEAAQTRIEALVRLAQEGDREAFAQLYDAYVDTVFRYVLVRVGNRPLAEDLTSETFIRAMRRIDSFTWQGRDIAAWFVTIARNLIADHVKSARFRFEVTTADMRDADEQVDAPEAEVLARLRDERLVSAIRQLGPEQAECITLRFLQGLSLAETARVLGKSEGAVKQLQLRATRALRKSLEGVEL
ncbi:sigma-70 family RNA polymerase sigma factor [Intrasporangium calvum]|uniref:Sigma-70 family RNA polymerase sigma factor n=1 Tax=Intrasporangium calvum TaxID=53358 RepID=A0ABT5GDT2_9MICO|nr:sigma-70 family RNA polymerase sigma factor [Intrasporangium calvum]MDC5696419.1 sigma-70 family RNA polymerase sigma factor [Intrasporangium calvum]